MEEKMEYWKNGAEAIEIFVKLFEAVFKEEELSDSLKKVNQLICFDYSQEGGNDVFYIDLRNGQSKVAPGRPPEEPDLTLSASLDDAHRSWSNKLNPVLAITRKRILVKGSATGLLKLAPKLKKISAIYYRVLEENGKTDIIL